MIIVSGHRVPLKDHPDRLRSRPRTTGAEFREPRISAKTASAHEFRDPWLWLAASARAGVSKIALFVGTLLTCSIATARPGFLVSFDRNRAEPSEVLIASDHAERRQSPV